MWNSLKSDIYRIRHTRSFYIMLALCVLLYILIFTGSGIVSNGNFAQYTAGKNTFVEFLYFLPKSAIFQAMILVFIGMFLCDEYASGFVKNTYPILTQKWKIVVSRYILFIIISAIFLLACIVACSLVQIFYQANFGAIQWVDYIVYLITQILFLATFSSFLSLIHQLTKSRVLIIILGFTYGFMLLYTIVFGIGYFIAPDVHVTEYMLYEVSGCLPYTVQWDEYQKAFMVIISFTILYNGISYLLLKKKDIA